MIGISCINHAFSLCLEANESFYKAVVVVEFVRVVEVTGCCAEDAALRRQTEESSGGDKDIERRAAGAESL